MIDVSYIDVKICEKDGAKTPTYATDGDSGMDVYAYIPDEEDGVVLYPGERILIPTGVKVELPFGFEFQARPKSGLSLKHGVTLVNTPGTIDCGYRGEIGMIIVNHGLNEYKISHGDKIAQIVLQRVPRCNWVHVTEEEFSTSERGVGGYGSTGNK